MTFEDFTNRFEKVPVAEHSVPLKIKPVVTVCIQTYNHADFIGECLESVLKQKTTFPIEILLADDDSCDGTRDICFSYAKKYPEKIRLFLHSRKNNITIRDQPSSTFIALYNFYKARGKYISICEGDDFWGDPLKLQKQFVFLENNPCYSLCYHNYEIINSSGSLIISDKAFPLVDDLNPRELLLSFKHPATLTIFFRNVINDYFPEESTRVLALDTFLTSFLGNFGAGKYLEEVAPSFYRIHSGGIWSQTGLHEKLLFKIGTYHELSQFYLKKNNREISLLFQKRIKKINQYMIFLSLKNLKFRRFFSLTTKYLVQFFSMF